MFLLCLLFYSNIMGGNIATPTIYIFVFVNEVCNKISARFPSMIYIRAYQKG